MAQPFFKVIRTIQGPHSLEVATIPILRMQFNTRTGLTARFITSWRLPIPQSLLTFRHAVLPRLQSIGPPFAFANPLALAVIRNHLGPQANARHALLDVASDPGCLPLLLSLFLFAGTPSTELDDYEKPCFAYLEEVKETESEVTPYLDLCAVLRTIRYPASLDFCSPPSLPLVLNHGYVKLQEFSAGAFLRRLVLLVADPYVTEDAKGSNLGMIALPSYTPLARYPLRPRVRIPAPCLLLFAAVATSRAHQLRIYDVAVGTLALVTQIGTLLLPRIGAPPVYCLKRCSAVDGIQETNAIKVMEHTLLAEQEKTADATIEEGEDTLVGVSSSDLFAIQEKMASVAAPQEPAPTYAELDWGAAPSYEEFANGAPPEPLFDETLLRLDHPVNRPPSLPAIEARFALKPLVLPRASRLHLLARLSSRLDSSLASA